MYEIERYVARELLQIKNETAAVSYLTTFWLGSHIMIVWDKVYDEVTYVWGVEKLDDDELEVISGLVCDFINTT